MKTEEQSLTPRAFLAQKVAVQDVGRAVGGETTAMMMMGEEELPGTGATPPSLWAPQPLHHDSAVQVSSFPLPPPPQTRPSSSVARWFFTVVGGRGVRGVTHQPTHPSRTSEGIIRLRAVSSSIYCRRFIILGFLSLGYKVIQLKEVTENKAMRE